MRTIDPAALHALADDIAAALTRERQANSDEARAEAQQQALDAHGRFLEESGMLDLLQRRMVAQIQGKQAHADVLASALPAALGSGHGRVGARAARSATIRNVLDSGIIPKPSSDLIAGALWAADTGRSLFDPEPVTGVDADSGALMFIRIEIARALGYEAGVKGFETRLLPHDHLDIARRYYVRMAAAYPGTKPMSQDISTKTISDWCSKGGIHADIFQDAYRAGLLDRAFKRINASMRLSNLKLRERKPK